MSNVFGRISGLLKSEISARFDGDDDESEANHDDDVDITGATSASFSANAQHRRVSPETAYRMLELDDGALLDDVRAQYRVMAQRYHARSVTGTDEQKIAAQGVLDTLTSALEALEDHLLPLPPRAGKDGAAE